MILVMDVGGTTTRLGVSRIGVTLDRHREIPTPQGRQGLKELASAAQHLLGKASASAVVAGFPATFTKDRKFYRLNNLPEWDGVDPAPILRKLTSGDVLYDNDALMGALGEAYVGAGSTQGVMAYVTVSTGMNGARLVNGMPDITGHYQLGDQLIGLDRPVRLEELVGGRYIQERYGRLPSSVDDPAVWAKEVRALAVGLHNLMVHWSPDQIVLGGSMMRDIPLDLLEQELGRLPNPYPRIPELRPAALGQLGGLNGALAYWRNHHKFGFR